MLCYVFSANHFVSERGPSEMHIRRQSIKMTFASITYLTFTSGEKDFDAIFDLRRLYVAYVSYCSEVLEIWNTLFTQQWLP